MPTILPLSTQPPSSIEGLLDAAFGPDRHGRTAYTIRRGMKFIPELSYALQIEDGSFVGLLQSWPVALLHDEEQGETPLIMVGPVAVIPKWQQAGYGRMLMDRLVADADKFADAPLMMIGDPEYYQRFWGFSSEGTAGWAAPGPFEPRRLLMRNVTHAPILTPSLTGMLGPRHDH